MKNLNYILALVSVILACWSLTLAPDSIDYEMHTNEQAINNMVMLLVLAVLFMAGAILLSLFPLSDESGKTKPRLEP